MKSFPEKVQPQGSLQRLWVVFGVLFVICDSFASNEGMCFLCCWDLDLLLMLSLLLCLLTGKMWEKVKRLKFFAFFFIFMERNA